MPDELTTKLDTAKLDKWIKSLETEADRIVGSMAFEVQANAQTRFGTGPTGRTYKRGNVEHVASAPPGPPAVDTGALRAGVRSWRVKPGTWQVGDSTGEDGYGADLEFGTPHIAPRPWLFPAYFKMVQAVKNKFKELFK